MSNLFNRRQAIRMAAASVAVGVALATASAEAQAASAIKKWDHEIDVVVVGLGVAGGAAAYEAVKAGAEVVVIDRGSAAINESHGNDIYLGGSTPTATDAAVKRMDGIPCFFPVPRFAGILVNSSGQRFIAEESYYGVLGYRIVREQGGFTHLIIDADMVGVPAAESRGHGKIDAKTIAKADTVAELEKMLNIPETGLQQTLATYNTFAAKGQDPFFHKAQTYLKPIAKPPFYAAKASIDETTFAHYTLGGLHTNAKTEVLDPTGEPIPGLYAVGRTAAGILNYRFYLSGLSLGEGTMFGHVAGQALAKVS